MRLVIGLSFGLILLLGARALLEHRISLGDFVEVSIRMLQLTWPAMSVGFIMSIYSRGQASIARINNLLSYIPTIIDGPYELRNLHSINVKDLKLNSQKINHSISFSIKSHELVGIVGPSGSFKSTLLRALYRRHPLAPAKIFFNDHDIISINLNSLYNNIAVVNQEPLLFNTSIRKNLSFYCDTISDKELIKILAVTKLNDEINHMPNGLDTLIGERGISLSGGQRQRVALARALLAKRALLILDDALSAVDAHTEEYIINNLKDYAHKSMILISTHRLNVLAHAHNILVLDKADIVDQGRHEELLARSSLYQQLWGLNRE
jgi:ATP-binding cassette subfamily B protein